ncbi:MAG: universal stress protein [Rhodospirillales bacterium]
MFRRVLVPVRGDGQGKNVLTLGGAIVRPNGGHLQVIHVHARPEDLLPFGVPVPKSIKESILSTARSVAEAEEGRLHELFREYCSTHDVEEVTTPPADFSPGTVTATWQEEEGKQAAIVGIHGRLADLVVVARPDRNSNLGMNTFQSSLFAVGALTAVAPDREVASVLDHVAIGWNGSVESARAVKRSMRLLDNAKKLTIVSGEAEQKPVLGPDALRDYFASYGLDADIKTFSANEDNLGKALIDTVEGSGAQMFVMGAYGSGSRGDFVLGGATEYVLHHADFPLLMAH